jgi:rhodanese-related sulfurtransferase
MSFFDKLFAKKGPTTQEIAADKSVLIEKIRQTELFKDVPPPNLEALFNSMESVNLSGGDVVIKEGDEGDYYYLLVRGLAKVTRKGQEVAKLNEPTGFGEEALISNAKRNATVTMITDGTVMRLSKDAFNDHVKEPLVMWFSPVEAQEKIAVGAKWVDVREGAEAQESHLHGAIAIPMSQVRNRMSELDKSTLYICYCENGRMGSTAAFLLRQRGYNVGVLRGGVQSLKRAGLA